MCISLSAVCWPRGRDPALRKPPAPSWPADLGRPSFLFGLATPGESPCEVMQSRKRGCGANQAGEGPGDRAPRASRGRGPAPADSWPSPAGWSPGRCCQRDGVLPARGAWACEGAMGPSTKLDHSCGTTNLRKRTKESERMGLSFFMECNAGDVVSSARQNISPPSMFPPLLIP